MSNCNHKYIKITPINRAKHYECPKCGHEIDVETYQELERLKSIIRLLRTRQHRTQGKQDIERKELELLGLTVEELYEV